MNIKISLIIAVAIFICILILIMVTSFRIFFKSCNYRKISCSTFYKIIQHVENYGEYLVYKEIENLSGYFKVLANLQISINEEKKIEIDMIIIHENGLFVIESKNYRGCIYGKENKKEWIQVLDNGFKKTFDSPIFKNKNNIKDLINILNIVETEDIYSLIVFSEKCNLKHIEISNYYTKIIKRNQLVEIVNSLINSTDNVYSKDDVQNIYNSLIRYIKVSDDINKKNIEMIKSR